MAGTILVLLTWLVCGAAVMAVGLAPALLSGGGRGLGSILRSALWWGLLVIVLLVLAASLWFPLRSAGAALVVLVPGALVAVAGAVLLVGSGRRRPALGWHGRRWLVVPFAAIAACIGYLAVSALGPVTNYDSGLYHLGAIRYAGDYAAIPGLANLYFPFGYNTSTFPLAAFLGNGPWDGQGFRLLNGFVIVLMGADVVLRLLQRRYSVGTSIMVVGLAVAWIPMVALSDYWVTSPSQDSSVLMISIVSAAYLADAVWDGRRWLSDGLVAFVCSVLLVSVRPLMAFFALATVIVLAIAWWRRRRERVRALPLVIAGVLAVLIAVVQSARDYVLSGWLQFPLAIVPFDVDWQAPNPSDATSATLGAARDPSDLWAAAHGWSWIPAWLATLPTHWETYVFVLVSVAAIVAVIVAARVSGHRPRRALLLAMAPSVVTVVVWWIATPPSFRFVWGPLFLVAVVPLGWSIHVAASTPAFAPSSKIVPGVTVAVGLVLGLLVVFCGATRMDTGAMTQERALSLGPFSIGYRYAPVALPETTDHPAQGGLVLRVPVPSDQCWDDFPLCVGSLPPTLQPRGPALQDGFRQ